MYKDNHDAHIIFATQEPIELTPEILEKLGGRCVKPGNGDTFDPFEEFCKLPEEKKAEFVNEIVKIIEKNEMED